MRKHTADTVHETDQRNEILAILKFMRSNKEHIMKMFSKNFVARSATWFDVLDSLRREYDFRYCTHENNQDFIHVMFYDKPKKDELLDFLKQVPDNSYIEIETNNEDSYTEMTATVYEKEQDHQYLARLKRIKQQLDNYIIRQELKPKLDKAALEYISLLEQQLEQRGVKLCPQI